MRYIEALKLALNQEPKPDCNLTDAAIGDQIAEISATLKGPLSVRERMLLVADRSELRATLKSRQKVKP